MKKTIFTFVLALLGYFSTTYAQTQKGNIMVGGDIANLDLGLNSGSNIDFVLNPKAAWFIKDNIAVGAYTLLGINHVDDVGTGISYGIGPMGRYYIADKNAEPFSRSRFFAEAHVGVEGTNPASGSSTNGLGLGFGPGFAYFITPNIGLEALLKYNGRVGFGSEAYTGNLTLNIGFQIYLPSKQAREAIKK